MFGVLLDVCAFVVLTTSIDEVPVSRTEGILVSAFGMDVKLLGNPEVELDGNLIEFDEGAPLLTAFCAVRLSIALRIASLLM